MPAERKQADLSFDAPAVKLYLDDLEEIDRIVRNVGDETLEVEREVENGEAAYTVSSLDELGEISGGERLKSIRWSCWDGARRRLSVTLAVKYGYLTGAPGLRGPLEDVMDILRRQRRPLAFAEQTTAGFLLLFTPLLFVLIMSLQVAAGVGDLEPPKGGVLVMVLATAAVALGVLWYLIALLRRPAIIIRVPRQDRPGFWRRNRDQLTVQLAVALIIFLLGYLVGNR